MIRRPTWILLGVLVAVLAFTFYYNNKKALSAFENAPTAETNYLFPPEQGQPSIIRVASSGGEAVELARDDQGAWVLKSPFEAAADPGLAEAAASQVSTLRVLDEIDLGLDVIGLDGPTYTITIRFTGGAFHEIQVGSETPSQTGYYVRLDGKRSLIVSRAGLAALLNLVASPPFEETPTPSALPATAPVAPVTEAAPTPTP